MHKSKLRQQQRSIKKQLDAVIDSFKIVNNGNVMEEVEEQQLLERRAASSYVEENPAQDSRLIPVEQHTNLNSTEVESADEINYCVDTFDIDETKDMPPDYEDKLNVNRNLHVTLLMIVSIILLL